MGIVAAVKESPTPPARAPELDEITLARARRGEATACRALVDRYSRPVFALLSRMLLSRAPLVEDLAQETFLRVFRALPDFDPRGPARLSTWVLTIATRLALDELARRAPASHSWTPLDERWPDPARTDAPLERRTLGLAIARAVEELPADQRAAFVLREFHELDYAEIATALDVDPGTVKSRLSRAKERLRAALGELHDV